MDRGLASRTGLPPGALWLHGSSAGELLQARPLLAELRRLRPARPLVYSYDSPSAEPFLDRLGDVDLILPLPFDGRAEMRALFEALRPSALALVDAELWPGLLLEAERRGVPAALVAGRLGEGSRRLAAPVRPLYRALLGTLDLVGAVDEGAAAAFRRAGAAPGRVTVTGDPRVDEALAEARVGGAPAEPQGRAGRASSPSAGEKAAAAVTLSASESDNESPVVVAGSTWPDDEAVLIPALAGLRDEGIRFRLVLAPHDTAEGRLRDAERGLEAARFAHGRWSRGGAKAEALLVDRVGVLRALYAGAAVAWVGGGFRGALHNVMEPAAREVAVVTGPRTQRSWVSASLERAGGLFRVASVREAAAVLGRLLSSPAAAGEAGTRARSALEAHAGATRRTVAALEAAGWLPQPATGAAAAR